MSANVGSFLHRWAQQDPGRAGIIDSGHDDLVFSYGELGRQASRVAACLLDRGLGPGDRVAICTANGLDFIAAWFGTVYAGCATLPIPAMSTAHEVAFRLQHAGCKALLTDVDRSAVAHEGKARAGTSSEVLLVGDAIASATGEAPPCDTPPDSPAMLLYTSGTTGAAKCVCIAHESLGAHTQALVEQTLQLTEDDRVLGTLPLTHSYGIRTTLLVPFYAGASTVFVPRFSPSRTLELCTTHRITWLPGVPTMFVAWANEDSQPKPGSLRWCMSAGAPLVEDVRLRAEARLGAPVRQAYGLTEANLTAVNAPPDRAVPGSSGKPVAGVDLKIADDFGEELPQGVHGEVLVRGQNVMAGYLDEKLRSKDLILRGGASVYPSEVENVLAHHHAVKDVAVVGKPDDYYGEEIVAVVVRDLDVTARQLDDWAREQLASYKVPRRYAFVETLPRGASGKTLKRRLRDQLVSGELGAERLPPHRPAQ
jgi:long-chain acyl-CoA synthetase